MTEEGDKSHAEGKRYAKLAEEAEKAGQFAKAAKLWRKAAQKIMSHWDCDRYSNAADVCAAKVDPEFYIKKIQEEKRFEHERKKRASLVKAGRVNDVNNGTRKLKDGFYWIQVAGKPEPGPPCLMGVWKGEYWWIEHNVRISRERQRELVAIEPVQSPMFAPDLNANAQRAWLMTVGEWRRHTNYTQGMEP